LFEYSKFFWAARFAEEVFDVVGGEKVTHPLLNQTSIKNRETSSCQADHKCCFCSPMNLSRSSSDRAVMAIYATIAACKFLRRVFGHD
jgi:hypothetical protein